MNQMKRRYNHLDVYRLIIKHEKLMDFEIVDRLEMEFDFDNTITRECLFDLVNCTRRSRPPVIRMGPVPVTNWCMKG
jgi:hypothetical protein